MTGDDDRVIRDAAGRWLAFLDHYLKVGAWGKGKGKRARAAQAEADRLRGALERANSDETRG